ncbi:MAG TPA: alpha-2-macroglobulin, partial [Myxococcales bacterium]|nr:alpha-2-macroglobulin [Myxococcales bacterium]
LANEFETTVKVPPFPQEVAILHEGALLGMTGEKKLSVMARDVQALQFEVGRVIPTQINHLVSQTSGHFAHPSFNGYTFNEDNIVERFSEVRALEPTGRGKAQYAAFDFNPRLGPDKRGLFFFKVRAWDPNYHRPSGPEDSRLILVTDLGLLVKDNADGSHDVFVESIGKGEAASGAVVTVLGKNGIPVLTQTSDADGHASFPKLTDFKREQEPVAWMVRRGEDLAFMPVDRGDRQLNFSRFDVGGIYGASSPDRLNAFLFSDRGLYRPGDTFHVAGIVKPSDWNQTVNGIPLEVAITDPRGLEIHKQKMALNESGFLEISYATEETSPTGQYQVSFYVISDGRRASLLGSTTVRVEEFLPDRMKISTRFSTERLEGWVSPENLKGEVTLKNLFGIPASNHRVSAEITLSPAYPVFRPYRDYTFYDPMVARKSFSERLEDTTTDDDGNVELELNLERFEKATYRVSLLAEGFEKEGGRGVSSEASVVVSPMSYLIGHKADGNLRYIQKDSARNVQLIAVDPTLKKVAAKGLKAHLIELRWVSVLTQIPNGTYQYQSVQKEITASKKELSIPADGMTYALNTTQPGDFALVVRDATDTEIARVAYSVAGTANLQRTLERNAELELKLAKAEFATGEEIQMQIKAPYTGAGLITIERDRLYAQKWFRTDTTASVQTIKVPAGLEGNGYVNVAFVRSMSSPEIFMSPLSYAVAPFTVNHEARVNAITLDSPELARPGEPYQIKYKGSKAGKAVVFAVDEGILQVAAYSTPDPLAFFFKKRALEVRTAQILDLLLPELAMVKASTTGGDEEGYGAIGKNLNPFKRKRDKPVAYWSGIVDIDETERTLTYDVPDSFNGSLRVMAVAVSPQAVGASMRKAIIRAPFVLSPSVPTFVAPGDEFQVSVGVANGVEGSGKDVPVAVELKAGEQLEVLDGTGRTEKVSEGREGSVTFKLRAKRALGSANLTFTAGWKDKKSKQSIDLSVRPPVPYLTTVSTGSLKNKKAEIPVARRMYREYRENDVAASVLPLGMARGLVTYLDKYPYGCTEQIVSRAFPSLVLRPRKEFGVSAASADLSFQNALKTLQTRQNDRGAFGFWAANSYVSDFQVAYAAHFLTEAKERGLPVPPEVLSRALVYLRSMATKSFSSDWEARDRAYALYVLARNGGATGALITQLREQMDQTLGERWKTDLSAAYLAGAYKLVKQDKLADKAMSGVKIGGAAADYMHFYDSLLHDAGVLYIAARHFPDRLDSLSGPAVAGIAAPITSGWYNTLNSSYAILALDAYLTALGPRANAANLPFALSQFIDNKPQPLKLPDGLFPHLNFSEQATKLVLDSDTDVPAFFQVTQAGFDLDPPKDEIKEQLEVQRELQTLEGKVVKEAPLGSEVEVHVKLRAVQSGGTSHVAIVDLLPGGFEVVMERPKAAPAAESEESPSEEGGGEAEEGSGNEGAAAEGEGEAAEESASEEPEDNGRSYTSNATEAGYGYVPPIGQEKSSFHPEYVDVREDRVVIYGMVDSSVSEFVYRIKATNEGQFTMPPAFAEGMYDRRVRARSASGTVKVTKP